ncbi:MAG: 3-dehydroquinate synthase [Candidatus Zixiibacteriota bacterium]|nr:MAG: 3-dehydroquinate synthase [candidate division Zixibacteria bacterium]
MPRIRVNLGGRSYPVVIGSDMSGRLPLELERVANGGRVFVIYDAQIYALYARHFGRLFKSFKNRAEFVVPSGEKSKSITQLQGIYDFLLAEKITRSDLVVACGGGVISDLVGYAAATTLRGIRWAVISTTLLGMVDAAIGGKTGINHRQGKNLLGAFWQPCLVWCDADYLLTLPKRQIISGSGELLKYAGLIGGSMISLFSRFIEKGDLYDFSLIQRMMIPSVRYKANLVAMDETDMGRRMLLNFGHTFGHAIEHGSGMRYYHGEALAIGIKAACRLGNIAGISGTGAIDSYYSAVDTLLADLPRFRVNLPKALQALSVDKKRSQMRQKFILLQGLGKPIIVQNLGLNLIRRSLERTLCDLGLVGEPND